MMVIFGCYFWTKKVIVTSGLKSISKLVLEKISEKSLERSAGNLGLKLELRLTLL